MPLIRDLSSDRGNEKHSRQTPNHKHSSTVLRKPKIIKALTNISDTCRQDKFILQSHSPKLSSDLESVNKTVERTKNNQKDRETNQIDGIHRQ